MYSNKATQHNPPSCNLGLSGAAMQGKRFATSRFDEGAKNYYRQQLQPVLENVSAANLCVRTAHAPTRTRVRVRNREHAHRRDTHSRTSTHTHTHSLTHSLT